MKFNINKKLRIGLIAVLVIAVCCISFLLYKEVRYPGVEERNIALYTYNNQGSVDYRVYLKSNELYDSNSLEKDQIYISEFVDYINADFKYEFNGDRPENLRGNYSVIAKVQGYTVDNEEVINIWEKDFPIIYRTDFTIDDENMVLEENINIRLDEYNEFVEEILETSKINCQTSLHIAMNINIEGDTGIEEIQESISPNLIIPLNTSMFEIGGNTNIEEPGVIEEIRQINLPVNIKQVTIYGIILGILVIGVILLIFFTEIVPDKDPLEKSLKKLFKKYGDRFVALNSEITIPSENINEVKSIDDLVRVADEIGKPIMYKYSSNYENIDKFYVIDKGEIYMLDINKTFADEKILETD